MKFEIGSGGFTNWFPFTMMKTLHLLLVVLFTASAVLANSRHKKNKPVSQFEIVAKTNQTIIFPAIAAQTFGAAVFNPAAKSNSGLTITYASSNTAVATIVSGQIHILAAGTSVITATQAGDATYNAAAPVTRTLTVNKSALTITANSNVKIYGAANPVLTVSYAGFVNGNTATILNKQPTITTMATTASLPGAYPVTASGAVAANYSITYVNGTLTVNKKVLTVTASNKIKTYGDPNPALTVTYSGFIGGETFSLTTQPTTTSTAITGSSAGTYPITPAGGVSDKYSFTYVAGTLTVAPRALTVTAVNQTRTFGATNPVFKFTYSGFVNGDTQASLATKPTATSTATVVSVPGNYAITPGNAASPNYKFTYVAGTLTVTKALLTIIADSKAKVQGEQNPGFTLTYNGFVNGDNLSALATQPIITSTATTASAIGIYPITASGAAADYYDIKYIAGKLSVTKTLVPPVINYGAPQTYTAGLPVSLLKPKNSGGAVPATDYGSRQVFAGNDTFGLIDGKGTSASFTFPYRPIVDASGNIYLVDYDFEVVRKITPDGVVTTIADASVTQKVAKNVAVDGAGNAYIMQNNGILKISPARIASQFITGGIPANFSTSASLIADKAGNLYVGDLITNIIFKISPTGVISTLAGSGQAGSANGQGMAASFNFPNGLALDVAGNLYVTDSNGGLIRKITPSGLVSTIAGGAPGNRDGKGSAAGFINLAALTIDQSGNLYVLDGNLIRKITPAGEVKTVIRFPEQNSTRSLVINRSNEFFDCEDLFVKKIITTGYSIWPALPAGLVFDTTTGNISGTPARATTTGVYTVTAYNSAGASETNITITINEGPPPVVTYNSPQNYITGNKISPLQPLNKGSDIHVVTYGALTIFAGYGVPAYIDDFGNSAAFNNPVALATDKSGNVYVADKGNNLIRKISPGGYVTTLAGSTAAGSADGVGVSASFNQPEGLTVDAMGNVYVADTGNKLIRKITTGGVVTTITNPGALSAAHAVAIDKTGNLFVIDYNSVDKISPQGTISVFVSSLFGNITNSVKGIAADGLGNLFVSDPDNHRVCKIDAAGNVSVLAGNPKGGYSGDGTGENAYFEYPGGLTTDVAGNVYVADQGYLGHIRKISPEGVVTTLAGYGVGVPYVDLRLPSGVAVDGAGNLFIADTQNNRIWKTNLPAYDIHPILPVGLVFNNSTGFISGTPAIPHEETTYYVTATNQYGYGKATIDIAIKSPVNIPAISYPALQKYTTGKTIKSITPANTGGAVPANFGYGNLFPLAGSGAAGAADGTGAAASFSSTSGFAIDSKGSLYVADADNNKIRKVTKNGVVTTFAGTGLSGGTNGAVHSATFNHPCGVVFDKGGNLFVSEVQGYRIRKITPAGVVSTFAGDGVQRSVDGTGTAASFPLPMGMAIDVSDNIYVADGGQPGHIRKITPAGVVTTVVSETVAISGITTDVGGDIYYVTAGSVIRLSPDGIKTSLSNNAIAYGDLKVDAIGNIYFVQGARILMMTPYGFVLPFLSGFGNAQALAMDNTGTLYIGDSYNQTIQKASTFGYSIYPGPPQGLTFDASSGILSGTPTATSKATNYVVSAYNAAGLGQTSFNIEVDAPAPPGLALSYPPDSAVMMKVAAGQPMVKPVLSPNGDGENDVLVIEGIGKYPENKFRLMRRNGQKIYEIAGYDNLKRVFDGYSNINGKLQPAGTYLYILEYEDNGVLKRKTGFVLIKY